MLGNALTSWDTVMTLVSFFKFSTSRSVERVKFTLAQTCFNGLWTPSRYTSKFKKDSTGWQEERGNKPDLVCPRYNWKLRDLEIIVLGHCSFILKFSSKLSMTLSQPSLSNHNVYLMCWHFYSSIWPLSQAQFWLNSPTTLADKPTDCLSSVCKFQKGGGRCLSLPLPLFPLEAFCKPSPPRSLFILHYFSCFSPD